MTDDAEFLEKKCDGPNLGPTGLNQTLNENFRHFFEFGSEDLIEIAYHDSL